MPARQHPKRSAPSGSPSWIIKLLNNLSDVRTRTKTSVIYPVEREKKHSRACEEALRLNPAWTGW